MPTYRQLDEQQITQTLDALRERIAKRFPEANLLEVSAQLGAVAREAAVCAAYLRRPIWALRVAGVVAAVVLLMVVISAVKLTLNAPGDMNMADVVQAIEAAVNDVVFFGIAVFFLLTIEVRAKRRRALALLHELRSLAHIIDMHQLTKDPERLSSDARTEAEGGARRRRTSGLDLARYLDFCSELLSLIALVAALLVQHFKDSVVLAGVNEIEGLTMGLSGKIWQKISILERSKGYRS